MLPEARARGYKAGRFSFNVKGGRCETCQGDGVIAIEMHFLPNVYVTCEECKGRRYNRETLEIKYRGKSIAEMLDLTVDQALPLVENFPPIALQAADAAGCRARLHQARPVGDDAVGRRGAARQAVARTGAARHRPHALHPRRADDGPALRGRAAAARRARQARRPGQHDRRHRAQPGRRSSAPTGSSTWGRKAARAAGGSSRRAARRPWPRPRHSATGRVPGGGCFGGRRRRSWQPHDACGCR